MLKKISILSLLVIIGFSQMGYYITFRHQQAQQKRSIKKIIFSQMKEEDFTIISLTDNAKRIFWEEEEKEFHYKGEMYDVVKCKTVNGKVLLYCINDKIEKSLIDKYNLIAKHNSSSDKKGKFSLDNTITLFVYAEETGNLFFSSAKKQYSFFIEDSNTGLMQILSPPPRA